LTLIFFVGGFLFKNLPIVFDSMSGVPGNILYFCGKYTPKKVYKYIYVFSMDISSIILLTWHSKNGWINLNSIFRILKPHTWSCASSKIYQNRCSSFWGYFFLHIVDMTQQKRLNRFDFCFCNFQGTYLKLYTVWNLSK